MESLAVDVILLNERKQLSVGCKKIESILNVDYFHRYSINQFQMGFVIFPPT